MSKIKIAIVIPCWQRSEILKYVMRQFDTFYQHVINEVDLIVVYVFSKDDPELGKIRYHYLNSNHPRDYLYSNNSYLGQKLNDGIKHAMLYNFDYMMNCGSDDLLHPKIIQLYQKHIDSQTLLFGLNRVYFYHLNEEPLFFSDYNKPFVVGAGRMIHKNVIKHIFDEFGGLYSKDINRGMDTFSSLRMHELGYTELTINPGKFPYVVDVKSKVNINTYGKILNTQKKKKHIKIADRHFLNRHFKTLQDYEQANSHLSATEIVS